MTKQAALGARMRDSYFNIAKSELADRIAREKYFHDMTLNDGLRTKSWVYGNEYPPNYHLWPVFNYLNEIEIAGTVCADIGTYDGMTAFVMADKGAARVDATCQHDLDRFRLVRAYQEYANIAYHPNTDLKKIANSFAPGTYDLVVISAMLHHLTSPLDALLEARRLLKREGLFILESIAIEGERAALFLNTELSEPVYGAPTLFVPTPNCIRGMLRLSSFEILSETRLLGGRTAREPNFERMTFLARASRPSTIAKRTEKCVEIQTKSPQIGSLDFSLLEADMSAPSSISFSGPTELQTINIWIDRVSAPLQPEVRVEGAQFETCFTIGRERDFLSLAQRYPNDAFVWDDVYLLGARYPGETMPDGMLWSMKQFGNLHIIDYVLRYGLADVLEVGPGFNLYFHRHLPSWCRYSGIDSPGFYDENVLSLANDRRPSAHMINGLLGQGKNPLNPSCFDACISASVLEHVPAQDVDAVCADMFRVLKPGGWALHSIDLPVHSIGISAAKWLNSMLKAGFEIAKARTDESFGGQKAEDTKEPIFLEPLSIRARFYGGYKRSIWGLDDPVATSAHMATVLVAARKPNPR